MRALLPLCLSLLLLNPVLAAQPDLGPDARVILLHHSTGECIWNGGVPGWFAAHNRASGTRYDIREQAFPKDSPYGWENYPYDYWNLWVRHAGSRPHQTEPTLEILTRQYDVVILKHCFPVSSIEPDTGHPDVASSEKRLENYRLQYLALREKMRSFPGTRFIVWTAAALLAGETDPASARRAQSFVDWVRTTWDEPGDNIYLWDFHRLETGGGLYLLPAHASGDSHPGERFSRRVAPMLCQRIVAVIQGRADATSLTGEDGGPGTDAAAEEPAAPPPGPAPEPAEPAPAAPPAPPATTEGRLLLEDAEDPGRLSRLWAEGTASYVAAAEGHAVALRLAAGRQEDWGEYGAHRVISTRPPEDNLDISSHGFLALRMRASTELPVMVTLVTLPDPRGDRWQPHFSFTAYLQAPTPGWSWVVVDLGRMELAVEGEGAHEAAGSPTRPQQLTLLQLTVREEHTGVELLVDDVAFLPELPPELRSYLQTDE